MKLEIAHTPIKPDWWRIAITVLDREDFPTVKIFQDHHDYPGNDRYALFPGKCNYITNVLSTKRAASHWSAMQVSALSAALLEWRNPIEKEVQLRYI